VGEVEEVAARDVRRVPADLAGAEGALTRDERDLSWPRFAILGLAGLMFRVVRVVALRGRQ
jgi:hypothetical protein